MPAAPTLTDGIVILRALTLSDVADHLAGEDDEHARRFGWFPQRSTQGAVRNAILTWIDQWETGGSTRTFGTREAATSDLVGGCELRLRGAGRADISYWTFPGRRGRGFAIRAVRLLCDYAFRELGVEEIAAHVELDNVPSRHVVQAAGFVERARTTSRGWDGLPRDAVLYLRREQARPELRPGRRSSADRELRSRRG